VTHYEGQRWVAATSEEVMALVLEHRGDPVFERRFTDKIDYGLNEDDCHIWTGALSDEGYGDFWVGGKTVRAHRVGYLLRFGEFPIEHYLDHKHNTCDGRRYCVNTDHLEEVTKTENDARAQGTGRKNQRGRRQIELALRDIARAELITKYGELPW